MTNPAPPTIDEKHHEVESLVCTIGVIGNDDAAEKPDHRLRVVKKITAREHKSLKAINNIKASCERLSSEQLKEIANLLATWIIGCVTNTDGDLLHVLRAFTSWMEARGHDVWRHVLPQLFMMMESEQLLGNPDCQRLLKDI